MTNVDLAILGGGAAGLALARRLAAAGTGLHVIVIEPRERYTDDRSWGFWSRGAHDHSALVTASWDAWSWQSDGGARSGSVAHTTPGARYELLRAADVAAHALAAIASSPSVELRLGVHAERVEARAGGGLRILTDDRDAAHREITARWVVDTRPRPADALLYQCFAGSEVQHGGRLDLAALGMTTGTAGLMTGMTSDADGFGFTYVLPLDATTALVEWTRFSGHPLPAARLAAERDARLAALGIAPADGGVVVREEAGTLRMGRVEPPDAAEPGAAADPPGLVRAGAAGGALRDATGYGFQRIERWAEACAAALLRGEPPVAHPEEPWARRQMDRIFLQALRAHPERAPEFFTALARRVPAASLMRFLTDAARPGDLARIILALPKLPFLAEIPDRRRALVARATEERAAMRAAARLARRRPTESAGSGAAPTRSTRARHPQPARA
ncbi:lycopene cyclase family protein [Microcella daejeonensis]|uniref:Lycopene cyclase family protein n=1 Tax=Microcella daejeonensis TaxID=2994971 RepID=A0A9E8MME9_9MICO|nr:lycopene cyclase family protein [Microcella daejeonensis]WAB82348.1 lycopene cyclase family protein [Microcella daejeonensis]